MFKKILVANRGEIAVRVQQTLRTMGISTVAVYSMPDAAAPHVAMADEAYPLDGETAQETYLDTDKILDAARQSGAQAVHPGYGFLSENPRFASACEEAGLVFIGPSPQSMEVMGDKLASKRLAQEVGVPVVPNSPLIETDEDIVSFTKANGFPLIVKAAAGGGGRGMRVVEDARQLPDALESAQREAQAAFGDGRVFLERYIANPRHIEFQVLADGEGNTIHMLERECSVQRRHQKIIEETPSPAMTPELRGRMGDAAVALTRAARYVNAGTIEFLVDAEGKFYFLEMNTRLQVEHPITESITGTDIVEWQVRIAFGESLHLSQEGIRANGHAIECRIYAEDPYNGYIPSTGTLRLWRPPGGPGVRLDSGVAEGQEISMFYDPMLAKLVTWGPDRDRALSRMEEALRQFIVLGVVTNIPFLRQVLTHPAFKDGDYHTRFLEEHPEVFQPAISDDAHRMAQAVAAYATYGTRTTELPGRATATDTDGSSPWRQVGPWRMS